MLLLPLTVLANYTAARQDPLLTSEARLTAAANYEKYCALCHGEARQGHVNGNAPSLRSQSLMESGFPSALLSAIRYGRRGTPMGGYLNDIGGPMTDEEIHVLASWLSDQSGVKRLRLSPYPVKGDIVHGASLYQLECAPCHGTKGEGIVAPALGNPSALEHNSDAFIRHAIRNGRQGTAMPAYRNKLAPADIDSITAYLRSLAAEGVGTSSVTQVVPAPDQFVINPNGASPELPLKDGLHVMGADLARALKAKQKMVLIDTRVTSAWQTSHIEGSFPLPYYSDFDSVTSTLPKNVMIVAYCSCPRATAEEVVNKLRQRGFSTTAVLYEGFLGYMAQGFPVVRGKVEARENKTNN